MEMERGSAKLLRERMASGEPIEAEHVSRLIDFIEGEDLLIESWWWKGQPHPDFVTGTFFIPKERAGDLFGKIFGTDIPLEVVGFPLGLVAIDRVAVNFKLGRG
jgi:hypothetical protein